MYLSLLVKYPLFLSDFNEPDFFDRFSKNIEIINFMEMHPLGAEFFHAYGRTDMTKLIVTFCNFANCPKICRGTRLQKHEPGWLGYSSYFGGSFTNSLCWTFLSLCHGTALSLVDIRKLKVFRWFLQREMPVCMWRHSLVSWETHEVLILVFRNERVYMKSCMSNWRLDVEPLLRSTPLFCWSRNFSITKFYILSVTMPCQLVDISQHFRGI